jgi:hypothetical protein
MYSNPASEVVFLDGIEGRMIYVFDQTGRQIFKTSTNNIDVSDWSQGIYYFYLESGGFQKTQILQVIHR